MPNPLRYVFGINNVRHPLCKRNKELQQLIMGRCTWRKGICRHVGFATTPAAPRTVFVGARRPGTTVGQLMVVGPQAWEGFTSKKTSRRRDKLGRTGEYRVPRSVLTVAVRDILSIKGKCRCIGSICLVGPSRQGAKKKSKALHPRVPVLREGVSTCRRSVVVTLRTKPGWWWC